MRVKEAPKRFHFLGICGTAMGSVAAALRERGFQVSGSDENVYPPMSTFLEKEGVALKKSYRAEILLRRRAPDRFEVFCDRRRRIRHGVLRQALQVYSLPAVIADRKQHRVRSRRYLQQPRRTETTLPAPAQQCSPKWNGFAERRR